MGTMVVAQSHRGQVLYCSACKIFHVEFGNVHLSLWIEHLHELWETLGTLDPWEAERMNAHTQFRRKVLIPMRNSPADLLFTAEEVTELHGLLARAVDKAVLPESAWAQTEEPKR